MTTWNDPPEERRPQPEGKAPIRVHALVDLVARVFGGRAPSPQAEVRSACCIGPCDREAEAE
jgi:hypothetical protein